MSSCLEDDDGSGSVNSMYEPADLVLNGGECGDSSSEEADTPPAQLRQVVGQLKLSFPRRQIAETMGSIKLVDAVRELRVAASDNGHSGPTEEAEQQPCQSTLAAEPALLSQEVLRNVDTPGCSE